MTATIKRTPAGKTCWAEWIYKVYVDSKVIRSGHQHGNFPVVSLSLAQAKNVARSEWAISGRRITQVLLDWTGKCVELAS